MELLIAAVLGGVVGYVLGRAQRIGEPTGHAPPPAAEPTRLDRFNRRLTKRQQLIVESMPQDPPRPTIEDLIEEEAAELGIQGIAADQSIDLGIRLAVYRRDTGDLPAVDPAALRFVVVPGAEYPLSADEVRLVPLESEAE